MNTDSSPRQESGSSPAAPTPADYYHAGSYTAEQSYGYLMRRIVSSLGQAVDRELEPAGLTNAQWVPLLKLYLNQAGTVAELARECEMDAGAMTRLLDRLASKGLCQRLRSSEDRRVVNLELTEEGREAAKAIPQVLSRAQNAHLAGFSQEEWQTLIGLLNRIANNGRLLQCAAKASLNTVNIDPARPKP